MREECHYCGGSRRIHLYPNYRPLSVIGTPDDKGFIEAKTFQCPVCADITSTDQIMVLKVEAETYMEPHLEDNESYRRHVLKSMVQRLVSHLWEKGAIQFLESPTDSTTWRKTMACRIGVVMPTVVTSLEKRVSQRQDEVAKAVMAKAKIMIEVADGLVLKSEAINTLTEAYKIVVKERELMKEVEDADRHSTPRDTCP